MTGLFRTTRRLQFLVVFFLVGYVASYIILSRLGMVESRKYNIKGYYFVSGIPEAHIINQLVVGYYYPLILIENWVWPDSSRPAKEPLRGLE